MLTLIAKKGIIGTEVILRGAEIDPTSGKTL